MLSVWSLDQLSLLILLGETERSSLKLQIGGSQWWIETACLHTDLHVFGAWQVSALVLSTAV